MEKESDDKKISERIRDLTTINFSITKCPEKIYKDFVKFCKEETNNNYAFGLKMLIEGRQVNIKEVMLYEKVAKLRDELEELKEAFAKFKEGDVKEPSKMKTMGSGKKDEKEEM